MIETAIFGAALLMVGAAGLWLMIRHMVRSERRMTLIEAKLAELESREAARAAAMAEADKRGKRHHSYNTVAGIQDATAILLDVLFGNEAEKARLQTAIGTLNALSKGPYAYPVDKPAGRRQFETQENSNE